MNTKLITAIRQAADALENGTFNYQWSKPHQCNCGVVASALLGKTPKQLNKMIPKGDSRSWKNMVEEFCPVSGTPRRVIFQKLMDCGMTTKDMVELEALSNPKVLAKCNFGKEVYTHTTGWLWWKKTHVHEVVNKAQFDHKAHVVIYLRAWANLLSEQEDEISIQQVPSRVTQLSAQPVFSRS